MNGVKKTSNELVKESVSVFLTCDNRAILYIGYDPEILQVVTKWPVRFLLMPDYLSHLV